MHLIKRSNAPAFDAEGTAITAYAAPSRGAAEVSLWQFELAPGGASPRHHMDREEILLGLEGLAVAEVDGTEHVVGAGDCLILSAGADLILRATGPTAFRAVACLPVGATATLPDEGTTFVPPWTQ